MIEILLKVLLAMFAVYGLYAFAHMLGEFLFQNENIRLMLLVDSMAVAEQIELHLGEAKSAASLIGEKRILAVVMEDCATKELLTTLEQNKISYKVVLPSEERVI